MKKSPSEHPWRKQMGERIKAHRERLGLSMEALAEHCGCTGSYVFRWERGGMPGPDHAEILMRLFDDPFLFTPGPVNRQDSARLIGERELEYWLGIVRATGVPLELAFLVRLLDQKQKDR